MIILARKSDGIVPKYCLGGSIEHNPSIEEEVNIPDQLITVLPEAINNGSQVSRWTGEVIEFVDVPDVSLLTSILDLAACGNYYVGKIAGCRDWKCLRDFIKSAISARLLPDWSDYTTELTADEQQIGLEYCPTTVSGAIGFPAYVGIAGSVEAAMKYLEDYSTKAESARDCRYNKGIVPFVFGNLSQSNVLRAEGELFETGIKGIYINRGTLRKVDDDTEGFEDWVNSVESFASNPTRKGLKRLLNGGDVTFQTTSAYYNGGNPLINQFLSDLMSITENGTY